MSEQNGPIVSEFWYRIYPELRHFKSREELREAKNVFRKKVLWRRRGWGVVLVIAAAVGGLGLVSARWLLSIGLPVWLASTVNLGVWLFLGSFASLFFWHRPYIRFVRQYLVDRGIIVCLKCGYDLRGQTIARCPECGKAFDPKTLSTGDPEIGT